MSGLSSRNMACGETGTLSPGTKDTYVEGRNSDKGLDLTTSSSLARNQCQDNRQRQARDSMGSEASCIASQRPYSQASGPKIQ